MSKIEWQLLMGFCFLIVFHPTSSFGQHKKAKVTKCERLLTPGLIDDAVERKASLKQSSLEKDTGGSGVFIEIGELVDAKSGKVLKTINADVEGLSLRKVPLKVTKVGKTPSIAWSPIKIYPDMDPITFATVARLYSAAVNDYTLLNPFIAFSVIVGRLDPKLNYRFHIRTQSSQDFARRIGRDVWFEIELNGPRERAVDWSFMPLTDFRLMDETGKLVSDELVKIDEAILAFGVSAQGQGSRTTALTIADNLTLEIVLPSETNIASMIKLKAVGVSATLAQFASSYHNYGARYGANDVSVRNAMIKFFESMAKSENQRYAVEVVRQGPEAIENELQGTPPDRQLSLSITDYVSGTGSNKKVRSAVLYEPIELGQFLSIIQERRIPVERGPFGKLHHAYSHHAQFIAGMRDLTNKERDLVVFYLYMHLAPTFELWKSWNLFFDSRGMTIFGNRYWRNLIEGAP